MLKVYCRPCRLPTPEYFQSTLRRTQNRIKDVGHADNATVAFSGKHYRPLPPA